MKSDDKREKFSILGGTNNGTMYSPNEMPLEIGVVENLINNEEKMVYMGDKIDGDIILFPIEFIGNVLHVLLTIAHEEAAARKVEGDFGH